MKRLYHILSLMALVSLFSMAGFVGFLVATGRLDAERMEQIASVLRGEYSPQAAPASQPATQPAEPARLASRAEIERLALQKEFLRLAQERAQHEMEQRQALDERIQLDVMRQLEEIQARRQQAEEAPSARPAGQAAQPAATGEGFEMELALFESLDPRKARDLLMQRKDPDIVRILMRLDSLRVKKIVDACKTESELAWIGRILNQIHDMDGKTANGVDGPNASSR